MKLVTKNITLENVKKSNYWGLIAILVWNHYNDIDEQDESRISFRESFYGQGDGCSSHSSDWDNPEYKQDGYVRTLESIIITLKRDDYDTFIYIHSNGRINIIGQYTDDYKKRYKLTSSPEYRGISNQLKIVNWLIENDFIVIEN